MLLGKKAIERYREAGEIVIEPFDPRNLKSSQYDITLGEWCYREIATDVGVYNPFDERHVRRRWQLDRAIRHGDLVDDGRIARLVGVGLDEKIFLLKPGEMILGHTEEFIGGRSNRITTMMKARSSVGRNGLEICRCLPPETELRRDNGVPVFLGDLRVGDRLLGVDRFGQSRSAMVKHLRRSSERKPVVTARTRGGRTLHCSPDHLLRVSRADGLHTIEARDLRLDDEMPVLARWTPKTVFIASELVSVAEASMLGYFVAEGNWQPYIVAFAKDQSKPEERARIMAAVRAVFPDAPEPHQYEDKIQYNSVAFATKFASLYPETACLGKHKRVPHRIFSAGDEAVRAFLGSYIRCDGHVRQSQSEIQTCSRSSMLIRDLALLAARVGSVASFSQRHSGAANRLQFYGHYYGDDANRITGRVLDAVRGQNVFIPDLLDQIRKRHDLSRDDLSGYAPTDRKRISRKRLDTIVAHAANCGKQLEELRPYVSDLAWDAVESISMSEVVRTDMMDLSLDVPTEEDSLFALSDGLMVLNCAGMGDVGYFQRWTLEIVNSSIYTIAYPAHRRVGQLLFFEVEPVDDTDVYSASGKYQMSASLDELRASWKPEQMLPKQWNDRECREVIEREQTSR